MFAEDIHCYVTDFPYLEDYIRSLSCTPIIYDNFTQFTAKEYVFIRRVPANLKDRKITFINTEQLSVHSKLQEYNKFVGSAHVVYDYSLENIRLVSRGIHLPYCERSEETATLKEFLMQPKEYDFAVIGSDSPHRTKIKDILAQRGFKICHVHGWNSFRDKQVGKCRALLNIHFNDEFRVYESIRCDRWRFAGMPIYSESCLDMVDSITFVDDFQTLLFSR